MHTVNKRETIQAEIEQIVSYSLTDEQFEEFQTLSTPNKDEFLYRVKEQDVKPFEILSLGETTALSFESA